MKQLFGILFGAAIVTAVLFLAFSIVVFCFTLSTILGVFSVVFVIVALLLTITSMSMQAEKEKLYKYEEKFNKRNSTFDDRLEEAKRIQKEKTN